MTEQEVDGIARPAIELKVDGSVRTLTIAEEMKGKAWVADPKLLGPAKRLKEGQAVQFKTRDETWIRDLVAAAGSASR